MESCWSEKPQDRPNTAQIGAAIEKISHAEGLSGSLVDRVLRRLEAYAVDLENTVGEKVQQLLSEQRKCDAVLSEMLPRSELRRKHELGKTLVRSRTG